jgi:hypothetical protein
MRPDWELREECGSNKGKPCKRKKGSRSCQEKQVPVAHATWECEIRRIEFQDSK